MPTNPNHAEQSPNWDSALHHTKNYPDVTVPGFPFREGWPKDNYGIFELILHDGTLCQGRLDLSRQYASEGKCWQTIPGKIPYHQSNVAGWKHTGSTIF